MIKPLNDRNVNCSKEDLGECRDWGRKIDSG